MSKKYHLNLEDFKKQLKSAVIWLAPLAVLYFAQLQGVLTDKKVLGWGDLQPTEMTLGAIQLYVVNQLYGVFNRWISGK